MFIAPAHRPAGKIPCRINSISGSSGVEEIGAIGLYNFLIDGSGTLLQYPPFRMFKRMSWNKFPPPIAEPPYIY
jgi:hypothetical protein